MVEDKADGPVEVREIITEISVSNLERSKEWYTKLFGKGIDLEPFKGNLEWRLGGGWVQISEGKVRPSSWGLRIEVRDAVREHERLHRAGIAVKEVKTVPDTIRYFGIRDPDDNDILFFQVLTKDPKVTGGRD